MTCMTEEYKYLDYARTKLKDVATLIDVGMNLGEFTDRFLERFRQGDVIGFEPVKPIYELTCEKFSSTPEVEIYNLAVGDQVQAIDFHISKTHPQESSSVYWRKRFSASVTKIGMIPLDELDLPSIIDFLKIDTEGAELSVLKGAEGMMRDRRIQFIQFEAGECYSLAGITMNDVVRFLYPHYYILDENLDELPIDYDFKIRDGVVRNFLAEIR